MNISEFTEVAKEFHVLGIKITKDDELIAEWHSEEECRRNIYSATKSFTSCAVGFAVQEGLLSLDEKEDDWVKMSLEIPFKYKPGTHFVYNNVGPYLAGILVQRRSGYDLVSYLMPRLFSPLGIKRPTWETDPLGNNFGAGGLFLTLSELHKFGLFYLNKGKWNGKQILSEKWIEESTKASDTDDYGYLFWRGEYNSYRADGKYSQISIILPDKNAVISLVAECRQGKELMRAVYDLICTKL